MVKNKERNYSLAYPRIVGAGFLLLILLGTGLLMLPVSVKNGSVSFTDALFTATSAACVTGLVIFDTFTKWTLFGQIVILCLIQIGGLGFITLLSVLIRFVKKKLGLKEKMLLKESIGSTHSGNFKQLVRTVIIGTVIFEILGSVILSTQFIPQMGFKNGLYTSVFLSVSAFCNAGFDVLGRIQQSSSLISVNDNPVILLTVSALIIIGGIGFVVWDDVLKSRANFKKYTFHTKLTLITTAVLLFGGTLIYFIFEYNGTFKHMELGQCILNSFFTSVTTRTAGFNSVPNAELTGASKMLTNVLMFIGGSSGSTAGGIKTSTVAVLFLCVIATIRGKKDTTAFGRRIDENAIRKATSILFINLSEVFIASIIIAALQREFSYADILFECTSALGTVGMTAGITSSLELIPKLIITLLMFTGRLTSLVFALIFLINKSDAVSQKPKATVLIG